ncbi:MAG: 2,3-bisphosphoglycerate-independent phosphoglycerate mutase, partial [Spirochaetae bacterium HGW-Spirochaetae-6]
MPPKAALIILDGLGHTREHPGNAVTLANMRYYQELWHTYPHTTLGASGEDVGLPNGQMGNSEVGHLNIGAGRVVYQSLTRIDKAIDEGSFENNPVILNTLNHALSQNGALHLIGLFSDGGVHSHLRHFQALLKAAAEKGLSQVWIHANLDGRDVPPSSADTYLAEFERSRKALGIGGIATIMGRYYGMDRDNRWERVAKAYHAIYAAQGIHAPTPRKGLEDAYSRGETDEFVLPTIVDPDYKGIRPGDAIFCVNFRPDRSRELTRALGLDDFAPFPRPAYHKPYLATMAQYDKNFPFPVAYPPENMSQLLSEVLSQHHKKQLRIAETEKYAHVTFFFNGQIEKPFALEDRILINSPQVATYDLKPEMSAPEVTAQLLDQIALDKYDVIIANYANPDMVGHTGNIQATIAALQALDHCLAQIVPALLAKNYTVIISADHGNAEEMLDQEKKPITAHSLNRVPFMLLTPEKRPCPLAQNGKLSDIAPTLGRSEEH